MRDSLPRSLQTTIIFLVVAGILGLALGGYLGPVSNAVGGSLIGLETWLSTRFAAIQDFVQVPRHPGHAVLAGRPPPGAPLALSAGTESGES